MIVFDLPVVLESFIEDASEEDGDGRAEQLQRVGGHPAVEQDLLAHADVELE